MAINYNPTTVSDGLVLALDAANTRSYPGSGTAWTDISYRGNNGTLTNGPTFVAPPYNEPFGGAGGVYFDGTGDYLTTSSADNFDASSGNWTIEAWCYFTTSAINNVLVTGRVSTIDRFYILWIGTTLYLGDANINTLALTSQLSINQWFHIAVVKNSTTYTIYINGSSVGSTTTALGSHTLTEFQIGARTSQTWYSNGYISNLRIVKGTALYTSNFTPPRVLLSRVPNTSLLTCQGGTIRDASSNNFTITANGDASAVSYSPYIKFDGTNDYVNVPNNSNFSIRSSTSFEIWPNIITVTTDRLPFGKANEWWFSVGYTSLGGTSGQFNWLAYDGSGWNTLNTGVSVSANSWYHLVTTWDGTVFRFYSNGSLVATSSNLSAKTWTNTSNTLDIGGFGSGLQQMTNQKVSIARIYQGKTLTAEEVSQNFNALKGRFGL